MLEDRDYMRAQDHGPSRWCTATAAILILNAVVFLVEQLPPHLISSSYLGLSWAGLRHGYIWQLLTFQFLHANLLHIALNSVAVFSFGFAVEQFLGMKRFLGLYLMSGMIGGLVHVLGSLVWPSHFGVSINEFGGLVYDPVVGASAGLFGLIAAFALMFPERDLTVFLFFVFPVTVSAKVLLGVSLGISILGVVIDTSSVAHGAHAGGILGGWLMLRFFAWQSRRVLYQRERESEAPPKKVFKSETDFVSKEVDPILEKISKQGIQSLSASERKILDEARKKMEKR